MNIFGFRLGKIQALVILGIISLIGILAVWFTPNSTIGVADYLGISKTPTLRLLCVLIILITDLVVFTLIKLEGRKKNKGD